MPCHARQTAPAQATPPQHRPAQAATVRTRAPWHCACGGGCPRCQAGSSALGRPNDAEEVQADSLASAAMAAPVPRRDRPTQAFPTTPQALPFDGPGEPLPAPVAQDMGTRFDADFSAVRLHRGAQAAASARALGAEAYATGHHIVFAAGRYAPDSTAGRGLLAHELAHVLQSGREASPVIRRYCSDPVYCTPYATEEEAESAEWWLRNTYMAAEGLATYGSEVESLYESYLERRPGDSLSPVVFDSDGSYLVGAFRDSWDTTDDVDAVLQLVGERLHLAPGGMPRDGERVMMSLSNFLSDDELQDRPINYRNPLSVAGHIAGGIGSSDAGSDYRSITQANVWLERVSLPLGAGYVNVSMSPRYEVFDAIDFCPGDCGSPAEQLVTVPMSRLEASGHAYDVPFKVIFRVPERSERVWL